MPNLSLHPWSLEATIQPQVHLRLVPFGQGGDDTGPFLTLIEPVAGATVPRGTPVIVEVTDENPFALIQVSVRFPLLGVEEIAYFQTSEGALAGFAANYEGRSVRTSLSRTESGFLVNGFRFSILRGGNWPIGLQFEVNVIAIDMDGNTVRGSWLYTATGLPAQAASSSTTPGAAAGVTAIRDEKLDPSTGDLALTADADQDFVAGVEGIASDVKARWQLVKGEYFLDLDEGLDWWGIVFRKNPNLQAIREEFIRVALTAPGCVEVIQFDPVLDSSTRTLTATYALRADTGEIFGPVTDTLAPNGEA